VEKEKVSKTVPLSMVSGPVSFRRHPPLSTIPPAPLQTLNTPQRGSENCRTDRPRPKKRDLALLRTDNLPGGSGSGHGGDVWEGVEGRRGAEMREGKGSCGSRREREGQYEGSTGDPASLYVYAIERVVLHPSLYSSSLPSSWLNSLHSSLIASSRQSIASRLTPPATAVTPPLNSSASHPPPPAVRALPVLLLSHDGMRPSSGGG
jgi:hypothetical protein